MLTNCIVLLSKASLSLSNTCWLTIDREEGERRFLLNSYNHVLKGFSAMLTETEASVLSGVILFLL